MRQLHAALRPFLALAAVLQSAVAVNGALYSFDTPELVGEYQNAHRTVELSLGMSFSDIDGASLRLVGTQQVGRYGDLNYPGEFPYPAELIGRLPELADPIITSVDALLPADAGDFDVTLTFARRLQPHLEIDLSPLADGDAEFEFSVFGPALVATTYVMASPSVTVTSATFIIDGTASASSNRLPGDYDGNGVVDRRDYEVWRDAFGTDGWWADGNGDGIVGAADYSIWRDHLGSGGTGGPNPEPSSASLVLFVAAIASLSRATARRRSTASV
jgi:hypothetical protein